MAVLRQGANCLKHEKTKLTVVLVRHVTAEGERHEVPPRDALGPGSSRRPPPHLISIGETRKILTAALSMPPAGTIAPLTWHYMFGLVAATGLRIGEAQALKLEDITPDGLIVNDTKFGKSRMVALHPTTRDALNRYLAVRFKEKTQDRHLFVLGTGRPPGKSRVAEVFLKLAQQTGIREPDAKRRNGPSPHSLRHSFAVRSLENLEPGADSGRHMLALATYLGHVDFASHGRRWKWRICNGLSAFLDAGGFPLQTASMTRYFMERDGVMNDGTKIRLSSVEKAVANDNDTPEARLETAVLTLARLIGDEGIEVNVVDQRLDAHHVVALAREQHEADQTPQCVDQGDDLGGQSAP